MKLIAIMFFIFVLFALGTKSEAKGQYSDILSKIETSVLGLDYQNQSDTDRLKRLEVTVYGSVSDKPIQQRVSRLSTDLSADLIGKEIKPKKDTFAEDENSGYEEPIPKEDPNVSYPMVDTLERATFNRDYKGVDVSQRLAKLEQKVFNKTYNDDLNSRVERLKASIMPSANSTARNYDDENSDTQYNNGSDLASTNSSSSDDTYYSDSQGLLNPSYNKNKSVLDSYDGNDDIIIPLASLEKKILRHSYPNDAVPTRLVRLETKVFKSTFTEDDERTRLDRIASAYQAQKSSGRYDNNKFSQHAATAMQIGAFLIMILAAVL